MRLLLRLFGTLAFPFALLLLGEHILLPGVPEELLVEPQTQGRFSVLALGLTPILLAYAIVEVVSFLVPRWSRLRDGNPEGRSKLERAALFLGLGIAALQAFGVATSMRALALTAAVPTDVSVAKVVATLLGGLGVLLVASRWVTGQGLLPGFLAFVGAGIARDLISEASRTFARQGHSEFVRQAATLGTRPEPAMQWAAMGVAGFAAWVALRARGPFVSSRTLSSTGEGAHPPYRDAQPLVFHPWIPVPSSSFHAYFFAIALAGFGQIVLVSLRGAEAWQRAEGPGVLSFSLVLIALTAITMLVLTRVIHRPSDTLELARRLGARTGELGPLLRSAARSALGPTALFFLTVILAVRVGGQVVPNIVLLVAMAMDLLHALRREWGTSQLVPVWEERRVSAVPAFQSALAAEGIESDVDGFAFLSLSQVFAPYAPARLLVARADEERAKKLLRHLSLGEERPRRDERSNAAPRVPTGFARSTQTRLLAVCAVAACGLFGIANVPGLQGGSPKAGACAGTRASKLEIVKVDDTIDPFSASTGVSSPPGEGIEIFPERLVGADGIGAERHFARIVIRGNERADETAARFWTWLRTFSLPDGARFALEEVTDYDEESNVSATVGFRTYVLVGEPAVRSEDVTDAVAIDSDHASSSEVSVSVTFSPSGARAFEDLTDEWTHRRVAILLDGQVQSAPLIRSRVSGGRMMLSMGRGPHDQRFAAAQRLACGLRGH